MTSLLSASYINAILKAREKEHSQPQNLILLVSFHIYESYLICGLTQVKPERHICVMLSSCDGYNSRQGHCVSVSLCMYVRADSSMYEQNCRLLKGFQTPSDWLKDETFLLLLTGENVEGE